MPNDYLVTSEAVAATLNRWAEAHGLAYEREGLLPPASDVLRAGLGDGWHHAAIRKTDPEAALQMWGPTKNRPERFTENLCSGLLAPGLEGTLAHHSHVSYRGAEHGWEVVTRTVALAHLPEAARAVRSLEGSPPRRGVTIKVGPGAEYGPLLQYADLTPSLKERWEWLLAKEDDAEIARAAFHPALVEALTSAPVRTSVSVRDGMVAVHTYGVLEQATELDRIVGLAAALAEGLRRAALALPELAPGDTVAAPADTELRRWVVSGAARVAWPAPPPDVLTAEHAYEPIAARDPAARRRARTGGRVVLTMMLGLAVLMAAAGYLAAGALGAIVVFVVIGGLGLALGSFSSSSVRESEVEARAKGWALEAFADGYARSRGFVAEDRQALRRRVRWPVPGHPERCMRGELAPGVDGHLVLWKDGSEASNLYYANLALVPARDEAVPAAGEPFEVHRAGPWLVVLERVHEAGRSAARLDALRVEAGRLAGV